MITTGFFEVKDFLTEKGFVKSDYMQMQADSQNKDYRSYYIKANIKEAKKRIDRADFPLKNRKWAVRVTQIGLFIYVWGILSEVQQKKSKKDRSIF